MAELRSENFLFLIYDSLPIYLRKFVISFMETCPEAIRQGERCVYVYIFSNEVGAIWHMLLFLTLLRDRAQNKGFHYTGIGSLVKDIYYFSA